MQLSAKQVRRQIWCVTSVILMTAWSAYAQGSGTFNGRVLDQGEAVLPGVTVTATNISTGVTRTTVTNEEGVYYLPGLDPGVYDIKTELPGFATAIRDRVTLTVNATITLDFKLAVAGASETVTVTGAAPLIEVTQSKVVASIQAKEVENLPMITRSVSGLLALLPGATPVVPLHNVRKVEMGSVSFGGSAGRNVIPTIDGADNRDNYDGGPLINFTQEGLEQFQLATHQFSAADGRSGGAALSMVTKSGTNALHGSGFVFARDRALIAKDYFAARDNLPKPPFSRQQYGGSIGGPIVRNRIFFFGAAERVNEDSSLVVPDALFTQMQLLVPFGAKPGHAIPQPFRDTMYTIKTNAQLSNTHSLMGRFAGQKWNRDNVSVTERNDLLATPISRNNLWSVVAQHSWVLGSRGLNQFTVQASHYDALGDAYSPTGQLYLSEFPNVPKAPLSLVFPSVTIGAVPNQSLYSQDLRPQIRDDVSVQLGTHALKLGASYNRDPSIGILNTQSAFGSLTFFDDPSVILSNSNGRYPQGLQTPGIVRQWAQGAPDPADAHVEGVQQFMTWFQDDWRVKPRLTLDMGVRYDLDINFYGQRQNPMNATAEVLRTIGNPYGRFPQMPTKDISPRVGFAYDLQGNGRRVLRGGYGLYFDSINLQAMFQISQQNHRPFSVVASRTNTAIGVGQLATYRYGIDPPPPQPVATNTLPSGCTCRWLDPNLSDPYNHQVHLGYAHELAPNTVLSIDVTHVAGRNDFRHENINPIVNGTRVLAPALATVYGNPNLLADVYILRSVNRNRYDELAIQFQRRLPRATVQVHYTLSRTGTYGGAIGGVPQAGLIGLAQDQLNQFAPGEWGPTPTDERHRVVAFGVFELPNGIQLSPVFQAASARPYTLTAGVDSNRDGTNNDRYVDPATGHQVAVNSQRGDPTTLLDLRVTKFFTFWESRRLGVFAELFNLFNTANFGQNYNGNALSAVFKQPVGFIPSIGYPRQLQLGTRFLF